MGVCKGISVSFSFFFGYAPGEEDFWRVLFVYIVTMYRALINDAFNDKNSHPIAFGRMSHRLESDDPPIEYQLRDTKRHLRTTNGKEYRRVGSLEVVNFAVYEHARRQGHCTQFLRAIEECAHDQKKIVYVESVLSDVLVDILKKRGYYANGESGSFICDPCGLLLE